MYTLKVYGLSEEKPYAFFCCSLLLFYSKKCMWRGVISDKNIKEEILMACFIVPIAEAIVTTVAAKVMQSKEKEPEALKIATETGGFERETKIPFSRKLKWLSNLLWGGSVLLAFEHVWHGEIVPWFPFLTAAGNPSDAAEMLHEMSTVGVAMSVLVTVVWIGMLVVSNIIEKRALKAQPAV